MPKKNNPYHRHRYPKEIIGYTVWLYHRFMLSLRDVSEILDQRGILVSYESIREWGNKFGRLCAKSHDYGQIKKLRSRQKGNNSWSRTSPT